MKKEKTRARGAALRALSLCSELAVSAAACVFLGVFLGKTLDRLLGTAPWLLLAFSLLGAAAALRAMVVLAKKGIR